MLRHIGALAVSILLVSASSAVAQLPGTPAIEFQAADDDIGRYRQQSGKDFPLRSTISNFSEHGYAWRLVHYSITIRGIPHKRRPIAPFFVVPHDNEDAAFDTMVAGISLYGGTGVAVDTPVLDPQTGQPYRRRYMPPGATTPDGLLCQREVRQPRYCDPNRNFDTNNPQFTGSILSSRQNWGPIIALHTNSPGFDGDGEDGRGNISLLDEGKTLRAGAFRGQNSDFYGFTDDDLILIPVQDSPPSEPDAKCGRQLVNMGINIWYETTIESEYDGSLSHYAVRENLGRYYNIEVGNYAKTIDGITLSAHERQIRMLNALMTYCVPLDN